MITFKQLLQDAPTDMNPLDPSSNAGQNPGFGLGSDPGLTPGSDPGSKPGVETRSDVIIPRAVGFVGHGVQEDRCVAEMLPVNKGELFSSCSHSYCSL